MSTRSAISPLSLLKAVHRRLLPNRSEVGWTPYLWLCYVLIFLISLPRADLAPISLGAAALTLVAFLFIYFNGYWQSGRRLLWNIAGLTALAVAWSPWVPNAMVFFIFAAGFTGAVGPPRVGVKVLVGISAVAVATGWWLEYHWIWFVISAGMSWIIGATNIYFGELSRKNEKLRRSQEEIERLATLAERERIARDLHDLLGHTLSVITMKAELARKLSERGDSRAATEIADVEQISRDALRQVREAVEGFREVGLAGEIARARIACDARGIELDARISRVDLGAREEAALAMVLREAVTNVARHSAADRCEIRLLEEGSATVLRVADNGKGSADNGKEGDNAGSGNGLRGMRERLAELDGELFVDGSNGWTLEARLGRVGPTPQAVPASEPLMEKA